MPHPCSVASSAVRLLSRRYGRNFAALWVWRYADFYFLLLAMRNNDSNSRTALITPLGVKCDLLHADRIR